MICGQYEDCCSHCYVAWTCYVMYLWTVWRLLEQERVDHASLKRTWQMANDQFLSSQRQLLADVRRMQSVLTAEQKLHIAGQFSSIQFSSVHLVPFSSVQSSSIQFYLV